MKMKIALAPAVLAATCIVAPASATWSWTVNSTLATTANAGPIPDSDTNGSTSFPHSINCLSNASYAPFPPVSAGASATGSSSLTGNASAFSAYLSAGSNASAMNSSASSSSHSAMSLTLVTTEAVVVVLTYSGFQPFDGGAYFSLTGPTGTGAAGTTSTLSLGAGSHTFNLVAHANTTDFAQVSPSANITANFSVSGVPAPGAVALMGLAGLVRRRRR
jgi:MYXO-CTERM domain-containing protein